MTGREPRWSSQDPAARTHPGAASQAPQRPERARQRKGKRNPARKAGRKGRRVPGAGGRSNPPGRPCPSPAPRTRPALCGAGTRAQGRGGPGTERLLFPRTKGTEDGGCWGTRSRPRGCSPRRGWGAGGAGGVRGAASQRGEGTAARGTGRRGRKINLEGFGVEMQVQRRRGHGGDSHPEPVPRATRRGN